MVKKIIPQNVRLQLRVLQRNIKDITNGQRKKFVGQNANSAVFPKQIQISQPIRYNQYSDNKIHNLRLATDIVGGKLIAPNQIFSFWNLIPKPVKENGFKKGRNLIGDGLSTDYGGGLCQLSGILYHLNLLAGLRIIERHSHSKDIYTEASRYTPLGSDATVVYGYKDLRIQNNLSQPVCFSFEITDHEITANICAQQPIFTNEIIFEAEDLGKNNLARVSRKTKDELVLLTEDIYEKLPIRT